MSQVRIHAPELPSTLEWLGTDEPLSLDKLAGNVVVLEFWTLG